MSARFGRSAQLASLLTLLLLGTSAVAAAQTRPSLATLSLEAVHRSAEAHHPRIVAAAARERGADAELLAARGGFDPVLEAEGAIRQGGYYDLRRAEGALSAALPVAGIELRAGYRIGIGVDPEQHYPTYYSDQTLDGGEVRLGARLPLLGGSRMDERRADIGRAAWNREEVVAARAWTRLQVRQAATSAYFHWVAAGRAYRISMEILSLAEARLSAVERRAAAGSIPDVEVLEARRALMTRRTYVVAARRAVEATALVLGLFSRDASGAPAPPALEALPEALPTPARPGDPEEAFEGARDCHPRILAQRAKVGARDVDLELAHSLRLPELDAEFEVSRDFGDGDSTLPGTVFEAGVTFELPLARREARGRHAEARAALSAEQEALRLAEERWLADLRDARSAFLAAEERYALLEELSTIAEALAEAERRRFSSGATSLLVVNIREASQAEAAVRLVQSLDDLWLAAARWEALTTCGPVED